VQAALRKVDGVEAVTVDYEAKTAQVYTNGPVDPAKLEEALAASGFGTR
jgi:copper chaperone CopZ